VTNTENKTKGLQMIDYMTNLIVASLPNSMVYDILDCAEGYDRMHNPQHGDPEVDVREVNAMGEATQNEIWQFVAKLDLSDFDESTPIRRLADSILQTVAMMGGL